MPPEVAKLLYDMKQAADRIARFCAGKTFDDYQSDELLRSGVERQFEIIGEAMARLTKTRCDRCGQNQRARKIADFRNALIHGYDSVDDAITWGVITNKLPILREELATLLA